MLRIILLAIIIIFAGCSNKQEGALSVLNIDQAQEKALSYSKSAQIINSLELRAKITATYLNPIYPDKNNSNERFFVGIYVPGDYGKPKPEDINRTDYRLVLQVGDKNETAVDVKIVDKKSQFFYRMTNKDNWSRYYIVEFPKTSPKVENMSLILISAEYGTAKMDFVK